MISRQQAYEKLSHLYNDNCSKLLDCEGGKKCMIYMRDRRQAYFFIQVKGNYIRGYKMHWVRESKLFNTFFRTLLVKERISDLKEFSRQFREKTPSLGWFDDE